jgi:hypothetical protein
MNLAQFERLLDANGSDPGGWPQPARAEAERLLAQSSAARTLLARQQRFDRLFDLPDLPPAPAAGIVAAAAIAGPQRQGIGGLLQRNWFAFGWPQMVGLVACLVIGFVIGALDLPGEQGTSLQTLDLIDGTGPSDE